MTTTNLTALLATNGLDALRTGTANDGRALFSLGAPSNRASALRDLRSRIPAGWSMALHANGVDAVLTHDAEVA